MAPATPPSAWPSTPASSPLKASSSRGGSWTPPAATLASRRTPFWTSPSSWPPPPMMPLLRQRRNPFSIKPGAWRRSCVKRPSPRRQRRTPRPKRPRRQRRRPKPPLQLARPRRPPRGRSRRQRRQRRSPRWGRTRSISCFASSTTCWTPSSWGSQAKAAPRQLPALRPRRRRPALPARVRAHRPLPQRRPRRPPRARTTSLRRWTTS
mmetsp:Transcript_49525/g.143692  ORF Transcript_49525/g.143692 Transcript_49525/m.143692 type:complete len:208 (+) Transcript_49525:1026-1649(+)